MNLVKKISLLGVLMLIGLGQTGCGPYYPYDDYYAEGWIVEEEVEVIEPVGYFSAERLTFEIRWEDSGFTPDLVSSLITPLGSLIDDGGPELDGCYFLGTYDDSAFEKVSMIECVDPFHGTYELNIENIGFVTRYPTIKVIKEYDNGYGITQQSSFQTPTVFSGDNVLLHYSF